MYNQKLKVVKPLIQHNHNWNITCSLLEALTISLEGGFFFADFEDSLLLPVYQFTSLSSLSFSWEIKCELAWSDSQIFSEDSQIFMSRCFRNVDVHALEVLLRRLHYITYFSTILLILALNHMTNIHSEEQKLTAKTN